jgi:type II secretory pathway component PulF
MPVLVTPRRLEQQGELYHQLAVLTSAGVGLISALEMVRNSGAHRSFRQPIQYLLRQLQDGATVADALESLGRSWLPEFDIALIRAGEQSGRLDVCFRLLADYYHERARLGRQVLSDLAYPALVLHLAVLVFPPGALSRLVLNGDIVGFFAPKVALLGTCYLLVWILLYMGQSRHSETWRALLERILKAVPILGSARACLALARLSIALEGLLSAGVSIIEAWDLAAAASGSPSLSRAVREWKPNVLAGLTPAEAVRQSGAFPELFTSLYTTGELSGQLDNTLRRLYQHYQEEAIRKMHALAQWCPRLIYFAVLLLIGYQVIAFWTSYFSQISQLAQ